MQKPVCAIQVALDGVVDDVVPLAAQAVSPERLIQCTDAGANLKEV
jgi:hypothetical protein